MKRTKSFWIKLLIAQVVVGALFHALVSPLIYDWYIEVYGPRFGGFISATLLSIAQLGLLMYTLIEKIIIGK